MATVIAGTLKATIASPDWHGHRVQALFSEQLELAPATAGSGTTATATSTATWIPAVRSAEVGQDGTFKLELPDKTKMQGPVALEVLGPSGAVLGYHSYSVDALSAVLELNANPQPAFLITPTDPNAGRTPKLAGRVVDKAARHKASNLQVVLYGAPKPPTATAPQLPPRPLLVAKTDANGYFFGDYPQGKFNQAYGIVGIGSGQKAPISLTGDAFPREVILVVDVPAPAAHDDCTCHDDVPRAPSPQDLVNSPETYSTDLGGGKCVSITVPNRALEEFSFYRLVRTTEPEIKGLHLPKPRPIPAGILNVLLQMTTGAGSASRGMLRPNGGAAVDPSAQAAGRSQPTAASSELPNPGGAAGPAGSASEGELPAWAAGGNWDTAGGSPGVSVVTNPGPPAMERGTEAIGAGRLAQPGSGFAPASTTTATVSRMSLDGGVRIDPSVLQKQLALRDPEGLDAAQLAKADQLSTLNDINTVLKVLTGPPVPGRAPMNADNPMAWDEENTFYQACTIAHGHLLHVKQVWRADGYSLGDLLYSLPLAPAQKKEIAVIDWERREVAARTEELLETEQLDASLTRNRDISEIVGSTVREGTSGGSQASTWAAGGGFGLAIGPIVLGGAGGASGSSSTAWQDSSRNLSGNSLQQLRDQTLQASSSVRSQRATVVQTVQQGETMRVTTEVVHNHNHCHAMTIEYFEVLRHFQISQELVDVQECLFVPLLMGSFDSAKALRWRRALRTYLQDRSLSGGFDAMERIAMNYAGSDLPTGRYADETIEDLEGELRISFVIPRPQDDTDDNFVMTNWDPFRPFLWDNPLAIFNQYLVQAIKADRDRIFRTQIAPRLAEGFIKTLQFFYLDSGRGRVEVKLDPTLVSDFAQDVPLLVTLRPTGSRLPARNRANVAYFEIRATVDLPADAKAIVHSGRLRYRTAHMTRFLFNDYWIKSAVLAATPTVIATPLDRQEIRNPREEDKELSTRLLTHLNEHVEAYHKAIWWSMDPDRRFMLLDGFLAPNANGRSVASVVENRLIGIDGNCLIMPVARGFHLDPTYRQDADHPVDLLHLYAPNTPIPPMRVSVPTRGVFAEAVMGSCGSCETKDDTRFWRWEESPSGDDPTAILPVSTDSRKTPTPDLTAGNFPAPLINLQAAPSEPVPSGLAAALDVLGTKNLFADITGLDANQKNAMAAFSSALDTASFFAGQGAKMARSQQLAKNIDKTMGSIQKAQSDGLITQDQAGKLAESALRGMIGAEIAAAKQLTDVPEVKNLLNTAAGSGSPNVKVSRPDQSVSVKSPAPSPEDKVAADIHVDVLSQNSADTRAFGPSRSDKSGTTSLQGVVSNQPPGTALKWSAATASAVQFVSDAAASTDVTGLTPGLTDVTLQVVDAGTGLPKKLASTKLCVAQFIAIDEEAAALNAQLVAYLLDDVKDALLRKAKDVVDYLLSHANARTVWRLAPFSEALPAQFLAGGPAAGKFRTLTIHGAPSASGLAGATSQPAGPTIPSGRIDIWPGAFAQGSIDVGPDVVDLVTKMRAMNMTDVRVKTLWIEIMGRLLGENIAHEIHHALLGTAGFDATGHNSPAIPFDLMNRGTDRLWIQRTGIEIIDHANFPNVGTFRDGGIPSISGLMTANQAKVDAAFPVPPVFS